ncbi:MAG: metal-sulfur cluster assembly factor [Deinococcales bacterium]|jgi:metal-sulfur cluster biosynthetic enzyme
MTPTMHALAPVADPDTVLAALGEVLDPELGIGVLDLGLVYAVQISGEAVAVEMTLTTPGCPLHGSIADAVEARLARVDGVGTVAVTVVWDPPWTPEAMSERARRALGFG